MYYLGRIVGAFFNQFFRFLFWNKKGQKILFIAVIFVIAVCFIKLGEVAAVEEVQDVNYEVRSYYEGIVNDAIIRLSQEYLSNPSSAVFTTIKSNTENYKFYFFYGNSDGSSYFGSVPLSTRTLSIVYTNNWTANNLTWEATSNDYSGVTGYTMYKITGSFPRIIFNAGVMQTGSNSFVYAPMQLMNYTSSNWIDFMNFIRDDNQQAIRGLLEDIKEEQQLINENLTNDDVSNVTADLPQDTAVDPTDSLWSDMFDQVRAAATSNNPGVISITIPFIDYSTIIEPAIYSPMTRIKNTMRPLYDFIILSWWFGASMWIVKDIHKYLEQIKNGDITAKDTNIKTEVL